MWKKRARQHDTNDRIITFIAYFVTILCLHIKKTTTLKRSVSMHVLLNKRTECFIFFQEEIHFIYMYTVQKQMNINKTAYILQTDHIFSEMSLT